MGANDTAKRMIEFLTGVYTVVHEGSSQEELSSLITPALRGMSVEAQSVAEILTTFAGAFGSLVAHYEKDCPDADIPGLLQDWALTIEDGK
jgi:hypothetical protein